MSTLQPGLMLSLLVSSLLIVGCAEAPLDYLEVKRVDEPLSKQDIETFLRIVGEFPDGTLPALPAVFVPPPEWDASRTLPVRELIAEEKALIEQRTSIEYLADSLEADRKLSRILRRERMTTKQFVGLTLCIGVALSRNSMNEDPDFSELMAAGQRVIASLERDETPFADYPPDRQFTVMQQAAWLTRMARCRKLAAVPEENQQRVAERWDELVKVFPEEFTSHPLASIADPLEETGTPFSEDPEAAGDAEIRWDPQSAIIGTDVLPSRSGTGDRSARRELSGA